MTAFARPDIVVGIDIGQTCSGVAYSIGPDWTDPKTITKWSSYDGIQRADKVATRVSYSKTNQELVSWGFGCRLDDESAVLREQFKLTLDPDYEDYRGFECQQARQWYYDYLYYLHKEIEQFFEASVPRFQDMRVEYSFSTPTTWKNPAMIATLQGLMESAGFAASNRETVRMALTEAEAAAIEASTTQYREGDIFLICDAGGGTTDINILKVKSTEQKIELEPLDHVEGVSIGSTMVDNWMTDHILRRLALIADHLEADVYSVAADMISGRFQNVKHSFPTPVVDAFWLDVPALAGSQSFPEAGVEKSRMRFERSTLREIFDQQLEGMFSLIDERIDVLAQEFPGERLSYIILSGGFGSSPYLYEQVQKRYEKNEGYRSNNTASVRIMKVLDPQLAVVRGLVRERTQQLGSSRSMAQEVFKTRRCGNSYGCVVSMKYDPVKHLGLPTHRIPNREELWVTHIVDWFIKQGEEIIVEEGRRQQYKITLKESEIENEREAQIVTSSLPADRLPVLSTQKGCQHIASVKYKLTKNDMTMESRSRWTQMKLKKKLWQADFFFVTKLGPADLRFQILGRNGSLSSDHDSLKVDFADATDKKIPRKSVADMSVPKTTISGRYA